MGAGDCPSAVTAPVVAVDALQLQRRAVDIHESIFDLNPAKAYLLGIALCCLPIRGQLHQQVVEGGRLRTPVLWSGDFGVEGRCFFVLWFDFCRI